MSAKTARIIAVTAVVVLVTVLSGCKQGRWPWTSAPTPTPPPTPATPTPSPTPIYIPQKKMEVSKLFNGMQVRSKLESEPGSTATEEGNTPSSYTLDLTVRVKVPVANRDLTSLCTLNEALPTLLPGLPILLPSARISPSYELLYQHKLAHLQRDLARLDLLITRHNFFDCETILEIQNPETERTAVLLQADMDVDTDGSDSDRLPAVDGTSSTFQPMTSYRWPKRTPIPNPFLPGRQARLRALETELAHAKGLGPERLQALRDTVGAARYEVNQLKANSFLMATTDPYIVLPSLMLDGTDPGFTAHVGDYCAVIVGNVLYPAVVGDIGPNDKVGEASYRIAKEINPRASADIRAVNPLKATYLIFPNSAEQPFGPPDLDHWYVRVDALLKEFGGYGGTLFKWQTISSPAPLPTPTPSPSPSASPGSPGASPQPTQQASPQPGQSPTPAVPTATPTAVPDGSPTLVRSVSAQLVKPKTSGSTGVTKPCGQSR